MACVWLLLAAVLAGTMGISVNPPVQLRTHYSAPGEHPHACPKEGLVGRWAIVDPFFRGAVQHSYEVEVNDVNGRLVRASDEMVTPEQEYAFQYMDYEFSYSWRVRVSIIVNKTIYGPSDWSEYAIFDIQPNPGSWDALDCQWIGGFPELRTDFNITNPSAIQRARAYVSGLGAFYFYVNGQRIGDHVMDPPQTVYPQRILYTSFDITEHLRNGFNAIGLRLGNYKFGYTDVWCNMTTAGGPDGCRAGVVQIYVEHASAVPTTMCTDVRRWYGRQGPITWDHLFHGETYDARLELAGWAERPLASFPQGTWSPVRVMNPPTSAPGASLGPLAATNMPPLRIAENFSAISVTPAQDQSTAVCNSHVTGGFGSECEPQGSCTQNVLSLQCVTGTITGIDFVSFGTPSGDCDTGFVRDASCDAAHAAAVAAQCVGKARCDLEISVSSLGGGVDPCPNVQKRLAIATRGCALRTPPPPPPSALKQYIYDFGQNMAGFVTLHVSKLALPRGATVRVEHAEIVTAFGDLNNAYCSPNPHLEDLRHEPCAPHQNYGTGHEIRDRYVGDFNDANMTNIFISSGADQSDYTPFFAAAGFRFVRLTASVPITPSLDLLTAHFVHTDVRPIGSLALPSVPAEGQGTAGTPDVLNRIHHLWQYSQLSNLWSIPTDCPQRERRGWMGDAQVSSDGAMFHFDMQPFYAKFLQDMRDDQLWGCDTTPGPGRCSNPADSAGSLADVVPFDGIGGWPGCPVWQVAYIVIAFNYYRHFGDAALLMDHYDGLASLMEYFIRHANPSTTLLDTSCYGDWIDASCDGAGIYTPAGTVTAFYYVHALRLMSEIALVANHSQDSTKYASMHQQAVTRFHRTYYNSAAGGYAPVSAAPHGSQTSNSLGLALNACPDPATCSKVLSSLVDDVVANKNHSTGGIVGMAFTFRVLSDNGYGDHALSMILQDTFPSFGRMVQQAQTTLCESWRCTKNDYGGGSLNHIMFGGFHSWLSTHVAGLDTVTAGNVSGWRHILVAPMPASVRRLKTAAISLETRFGLAGVSWVYDESQNDLSLNVTVPIGSYADVHAPTLHGRLPQVVSERGAAASFRVQDGLPSSVGMLSLETVVLRAEPTLRLRVGSGQYQLRFVY